MYKLLLAVFTLSLLSHSPEPKKAETLKVIAIADGDTFSVLRNNKPVRIRIDAIDAPERGMPYYKVSKQYLSALCFSKKVTIKTVTIDRYGRTVARVKLANGKDVSAEMIKAGLAWHYKKYSADKLLSSYEIQARQNRRGLWKESNPIAPWEVRTLHRKGISTKERFKNRIQ